MPLRVACPDCHTVLVAKDKAFGKVVNCPKCQTPIQMPSQPAANSLPIASILPPVEIPPSRPKSSTQEKTDEPRRVSRRTDDAVEPRRISRRTDEADEPRRVSSRAGDDRGRRRRQRDDEDDDHDDRPPKKIREVPKAVIVGAVAAGVLLPILGVVGLWAGGAFSSEPARNTDPNPSPVVESLPPEKPKPAAPREVPKGWLRTENSDFTVLMPGRAQEMKMPTRAPRPNGPIPPAEMPIRSGRWTLLSDGGKNGYAIFLSAYQSPLESDEAIMTREAGRAGAVGFGPTMPQMQGRPDPPEILEKHSITMSGKPAMEFIVKGRGVPPGMPNQFLYHRYRIVIDRDRVFVLVMDSMDLQPTADQARVFFESFQIK